MMIRIRIWIRKWVGQDGDMLDMIGGYMNRIRTTIGSSSRSTSRSRSRSRSGSRSRIGSCSVISAWNMTGLGWDADIIGQTSLMRQTRWIGWISQICLPCKLTNQTYATGLVTIDSILSDWRYREVGGIRLETSSSCSWLKKPITGLNVLVCVNNRGVQFHRFRYFKQYYFNSILQTSQVQYSFRHELVRTSAPAMRSSTTM